MPSFPFFFFVCLCVFFSCVYDVFFSLSFSAFSVLTVSGVLYYSLSSWTSVAFRYCYFVLPFVFCYHLCSGILPLLLTRLVVSVSTAWVNFSVVIPLSISFLFHRFCYCCRLLSNGPELFPSQCPFSVASILLLIRYLLQFHTFSVFHLLSRLSTSAAVSAINVLLCSLLLPNLLFLSLFFFRFVVLCHLPLSLVSFLLLFLFSAFSVVSGGGGGGSDGGGAVLLFAS